MQPVTRSVTGTGSSDWVLPDIMADHFSIGVACVVTGTATFDVEYTYDDVLTNASPTTFKHADGSGKSATTDLEIAHPVSAFRVTITAGTGTVTMRSIQSGGGV